MLESFFIQVNTWITSGTSLAALGCFSWGIISVLFSPCHLASIPLIVAYVGGQDQIIKGRQAAIYALSFSSGLFLTITLVGIICALLGRMLGDIGPYWTIVVGAILLWVSFDMLGIIKCSLSGSLMGKLQVKGTFGAFILGLAYGILSGSCTFGFIAPILAIITVQKEIMTGITLILLFAIGHCLPIAVAGSSTAGLKRLLSNATFGQGSTLFRKGAGVIIGGLGCYFIALPFF